MLTLIWCSNSAYIHSLQPFNLKTNPSFFSVHPNLRAGYGSISCIFDLKIKKVMIFTRFILNKHLWVHLQGNKCLSTIQADSRFTNNIALYKTEGQDTSSLQCKELKNNSKLISPPPSVHLAHTKKKKRRIWVCMCL